MTEGASGEEEDLHADYLNALADRLTRWSAARRVVIEEQAEPGRGFSNAYVDGMAYGEAIAADWIRMQATPASRARLVVKRPRPRSTEGHQ